MSIAKQEEAKPKTYVPVTRQRIHLARHLSGEGIEIGALHRPLLPLPKKVTKIEYVDRKTTDELRERYTELEKRRLVDVDIIGKAESLELDSESQDFIIANHLIEHTEGTFQTIENFCRILRPNGILFMAVPDKRYTFDKYREPVKYKHLLDEYHNGFEDSRYDHYHEWLTRVKMKNNKQKMTPSAIHNKIEEYLKENRNIHFHAWRFEDFVDHVFKMRYDLNIPLHLIDVGTRYKQANEFIVVLKKVV